MLRRLKVLAQATTQNRRDMRTKAASKQLAIRIEGLKISKHTQPTNSAQAPRFDGTTLCQYCLRRGICISNDTVGFALAKNQAHEKTRIGYSAYGMLELVSTKYGMLELVYQSTGRAA